MGKYPEIGSGVFLICATYIYSGVLESIDHEYVVLTEPSIVYETGAWSALSKSKKKAAWKNAERLPTSRLPIDRGAVEAGPAVLE